MICSFEQLAFSTDPAFDEMAPLLRQSPDNATPQAVPMSNPNTKCFVP